MDLDAPVRAAWQAVIDWARQSRWMLGTTVRDTAGPGPGVGGRLEAFTGLGPLGPAGQLGFEVLRRVLVAGPAVSLRRPAAA